MLFFNKPHAEAATSILTTTAAAATKPPIDKKLTLAIPKESDKKIGFDFNPIASVIYGDGTIRVYVEKGQDSHSGADFYIAGYCVSQVDPKVITKVSYGTSLETAHSKAASPEADGINKRFDPDTKAVQFDIKLAPGHLIFIGLIIAVRHDDGGEYKDHLFDPQLGNGPPATGGQGTGTGGIVHGQPDSIRNRTFGVLIPLE